MVLGVFKVVIFENRYERNERNFEGRLLKSKERDDNDVDE